MKLKFAIKYVMVSFDVINLNTSCSIGYEIIDIAVNLVFSDELRQLFQFSVHLIGFFFEANITVGTVYQQKY